MATSLASSVGTRVESASRHMLQCRVHKDRYLSWGQDNETLRRNKHQFSMTKDELVVDSASSLFPAGDHICKQPHPYPRVVTTWRGLHFAQMTIYCMLMDQDLEKYFEVLSYINTPPIWNEQVIETEQEIIENLDKVKLDEVAYPAQMIAKVSRGLLKKYKLPLHVIPDFRAMGYSVGTAYAHEYNGDTIASVMIGGLVTVQNGKYPMHTGDPVCWYVQHLEEVCFDDNGIRIAYGNGTKLLMMSLVHRDTRDKPTGKQAHSMRNSGFGDASLKDNVFLPKPFFYENHSLGDVQRTFAKCLSSAAPYEKVDIMIASQSI